MDIKDILSRCDHTLLKQEATWEQVKELCDDAVRYGTASVCISPCYVKKAKEYLGDRMKICTVIGFPNGTATAESKAFEARDAVQNGADEIDMVIHIGALKAGDDAEVAEEIRKVREACRGRILKVIIETCLLTDEEKIRMCRIVTECGADYIKTSTGFSTGGATPEDVALFRDHVGKGVKIKAAGGISSLEDAERFVELGADRLGTSRIVKLVKELENLGFQVTQATVSRDIKEMRLMKVTTPLGKYIYAQAQNVGDDLVPKRLLRIFSESILSVQQAENIVVVKTFSGSASAVGEAIDGLMWPEIVGTLAGDNTIMIVTRHTQDAGNVAEKITGLMS